MVVFGSVLYCRRKTDNWGLIDRMDGLVYDSPLSPTQVSPLGHARPGDKAGLVDVGYSLSL